MELIRERVEGGETQMRHKIVEIKFGSTYLLKHARQSRLKRFDPVELAVGRLCREIEGSYVCVQF